MSLIKRALFPGVHDGELLVSEVRPGERVKTSSALATGTQAFIECLKPNPCYTYVLVNAMGFSQFYGANSNTDWYGYNPHLNFDGLLHSWPGIGDNLEADRMKGKGWSYGYPCFYGATAYAHHKNTDPQRLGFGDVIYVEPNQEQKRIELVIRIFNDEALKKGHGSILSRIRAGSRVDVSMGCKVPFDLCSVCTDWAAVKKAWDTFDPQLHKHPGIAVLAYHKTVSPIRGLAITRKDYCKDMLLRKGKILSDGRKVFVYNDFPRFFDISFVWIGADRTARVMWHLASDKELPKEHRPQADGASVLEMFLRKMLSKNSSIKTAMMEKEIPEGLAQAVHTDASTMPRLSKAHIRVISNNPKTALTTLAALGIVLRPDEFQEAVVGDKLMGQDITKVSFDSSLSSVDDTYAVDPSCFNKKYAMAFAHDMPSRSAFSPFLNYRLLSPNKLAAETSPKPVVSNPALDNVGSMYNGYRLSVMEKAPELFPNAVPYLPGQGPAEAALTEPDPERLLLGTGPMIHLLSSHLPQESDHGQSIGTMASIATKPHSFVALATIGVAIREALKWAKSKGLVDAAKSVVQIARKIL